MLLIVGGSRDHNIQRLAVAAADAHVAHRLIHTDSDPLPAIYFEPDSDKIEINSEEFRAADISLFIRYDVFGGRPEINSALYDAIKGWAQANNVRCFNSANDADVNKTRNLYAAHKLGFAIPKTCITAEFNTLGQKLNPQDWIVKPVEGGSYTRLLSAALKGGDNRVSFVQETLSYPEVRLFRVGEKFFAFRIDAGTLDCRVDREMDLVEIAPPAELLEPMKKLSDRLGLTYSAADFKTHPATGQLVFLEINTMPMFTGYDDAANRKLSAAMVEFLNRPQQQPTPQSPLKPNLG
jgi:glutathione synthase/RimK-type ligase-like ATP-grasp enzyme